MLKYPEKLQKENVFLFRWVLRTSSNSLLQRSLQLCLSPIWKVSFYPQDLLRSCTSSFELANPILYVIDKLLFVQVDCPMRFQRWLAVHRLSLIILEHIIKRAGGRCATTMTGAFRYHVFGHVIAYSSRVMLFLKQVPDNSSLRMPLF